MKLSPRDADDISGQVFGIYTSCWWNPLARRFYSDLDEFKFGGSNLLIWLFCKPAPPKGGRLKPWHQRNTWNT